MSRHYHDDDCVPDMLESIDASLELLIERLDKAIAIFEMTILTDEQRKQLRLEREQDQS